MEVEGFEDNGGATEAGSATDDGTTDAALLGMLDLVLLAMDRASSVIS